MADKVDNHLEKMVDELTFYKEEALFSGKEITSIVKTRKSAEYSMMRKDADVSFFLDAIKYERKLDQIKLKRMKKQRKAQKEAGIQKKQTQFREENCIHRRIMNLYQRACRKFRQNKVLWLEYLQYLVSTKALQKLNKVLSECLQQMPGELEFWLVGVYADLELKGNMFSSRQLMLQGLRMNDSDPKFHVAYLNFELKYFEKIMMRREVLQPDESKVNFVEDCNEVVNEVEGETKRGDEANFVKIVWNNLKERYAGDVIILHDAKHLLKQSKYLRDAAPELINESSKIVRTLKTTESSQIQLLNKLTTSQIQQLTVEKITRIVSRSQGQAKQILIDKLASRNDCDKLRMQLCDTDLQRLQILYKQQNPTDFSSIQDHSSIIYLATYFKHRESLTKEELKQLENASQKLNSQDEFTVRCFILAKSLVVREIQRQRNDLAVKYVSRFMAQQTGNSNIQAQFIVKLSKFFRIQSLLEIIRQVSVVLPQKAFKNMLMRATQDYKDSVMIYELWVSQHPTDEHIWLQYIQMIRYHKKECDVQSVKQRALLVASSKAQLILL